MAESPIPTAIPALSRTTSPINYLFLVEGCVAVIVAVAFLFYWNRLLGNGLSWCIRIYTWRKHNAYINIGSLQISPLAGRILFRDVHYHSSNLSLRVLHGHVTWRYWKRRVRQEGSAPTSKRKLLPCRISIFAEGVELFVFNRTPAYDAIVERMKKHEAEGDADINVEVSDGHTRLRKGYSNDVTEDNPSSKERWSDDSGDKRFTTQAVPTKSNDESTSQLKRSITKAPKPTISWFREALPVELDILTGAIVLGNDATPMVLVIDFKEGTGTVEASSSRSPLDYYKFGVNLSFRAPKILMRTNTDYTGPLLNQGKRMYDKLSETNPDVLTIPPSDLSTRSKFRQLASKLAFLYTPEAPSHPMLDHGPWKGLARYREGTSGTAAFGRASHEIEYAKVTTLLDSPSVDVSFFYDEPGNVLHSDYTSETYTQGKRADDLGNGDIAPEYGIDIVIHGGSVKYGPWADRQRDALQKAFAPSIFFNTEPLAKLQPGDKRVATALKLNIRLDEETVLRLPTRESSKDWQYDTGRGYQGKVRPYGWLDVKVGADSYITYVQSQVATVDGYDSLLELHLDGITIVTSVNMQTFMTADVCRLSLSMPTPLRWNEERTWGFDVTMDRPEIFLLRDHVTLIADLAKDWSSGSTGDFFHFVPNHYQFQVALKNYALRMNLNDYNIVDRPTSLDDNAFAHLTGPAIGANVTIAAGKYRPEFSTIPFAVDAKDATLCLSAPQWDTHASFETGRTTDIGHIGDIAVNGSYLYYSLPDPSHQETLTLDIKATQIAFKCLGSVLRRLFAIKDNYFGSYTNFTTFSEFSERFAEDPKLVGDRVEEKYRPGRSDSFAVNLTVQVQQSRVVLPENIYDCFSGAFIPVPEFQMTLRSVDEFMEMSIDLQPTYLSFFDNIALVYPLQPLPAYDEKEVIFIEGVEVKAHRLFGPQPRAYTYLCLWEIRIAAVQAHVTPAVCHRMQNVIRAFGYNFVDVENAPSARFVPPVDPDVTFFKLQVDAVDVALLDATEASTVVRVALPEGMQLDTSSLATSSFDSLLALSVPLAHLTVVHRELTSDAWREVSSAALDLQMDLFKAPQDWQAHAAAQHAYVREQDEPSRRVEVLYGSTSTAKESSSSVVYLPHPYYKGESQSQSWSSSSFSSSVSDIQEPASPIRNRRSFTTARESVGTDSIEHESGDESDENYSTDTPRNPGDETDSHGSFSRGDRKRLAERLRRLRHVSHGVAQGLPTPQDWQCHQAQSSVLRIRSRSGIQVDAAPSAVLGVMAVVDSFLQIEPSAETVLDQLLDLQVDAEAGSKAMESSLALFDIAIPYVAVRVANVTSSPSVGPGFNLGLHIESPAVLFEGVRGNGQIPEYRIAARVSTINLQLTTEADQGQAVRLQDAGFQPCIPDLPGDFLACRLVLKDLAAASTRAASSTISGHCQSIELHSVHQAVLIAEAGRSTIMPMLARAVPGENIGKSWVQNDLIDLLHEAIQGGYSTTNPKFMDVESYALHADSQRSIRQSLGWMTLGRFRRWLRQQTPAHRRRGVKSAVSGMPFTAGGAVQRLANLKEWEPVDSADVTSQAFLLAAFPELKDAAVHALPTQFSGGLNIGAVDLQIHGIDMEARRIVTTSVRILSASAAFIYNNAAGSDILAIGLESLQCIGATNLIHLASVLQPTVSDMRSAAKGPPASHTSSRMSGTLSLHVREASIDVNASGIQFGLRFEALQATSVIGGSPDGRQPGPLSYTIASNNVIFRADGDRDGFVPFQPVRSLMALSLEGLSVCVDLPATGDCGVLLSTTKVSLVSKPKLQSLISFIDEWRQRHLAAYEIALAHIGLLPVATAVQDVAENRKKRVSNRQLTLDIRLVQAIVRVRASKALWLAWEVGGSVISITQHVPTDNHKWSYAMKLGPEALGVVSSSKAQAAGHPALDSSTLLRLPWVRLSGSYGEKAVSRAAQHVTNLAFGQITGTAKPVLLERLVSVYEHLRHDLQALESLWEAARHKKQGDQTPNSFIASTYQVSVEVQGLYFALRADGVASLVVLKASSLVGKISNCSVADQAGLGWSARVKDLALALGRPSRVDGKHEAPFESRHCSAYMILSLNVEEKPSVLSVGSTSPSLDASLNINLTPVHAVMHVTAMGEALDLAKVWSAELSGLRARRTAELAELRSQTTRVFKNLEPAPPVPIDSSWFAKRTVHVQLAGIGIAIPLVEVDVMGAGSREVVPEFSALLLAIHSFTYTNRRNETAKSNIQHLTLQFVSRFDQMNSEHFTSLSHHSKNKMSLPDLESQAQMSQKSGHWEVFCHSTASGFQLAVAPNITDHVFALIDLYETGKLRFALLEEQYRKDLATLYALDDATALPKTSVAAASPVRATMMIRASFVFNSGLVTLHPPGEVAPISSVRGASDSLRLPSISVWSTYKTSGAPIDVDELVLNIGVHSSSNDINPTVLPFCHAIVRQIEAHLNSAPERAAKRNPLVVRLATSLPVEPKTPSTMEASTEAPGKNHVSPEERQTRYQISLRIDQSRLQFQCLDGSKAFAALEWHNGGFLLTHLTGPLGGSTLAGAVSGVSVTLGHTFRSETSFLTGQAKDLTFNIVASPISPSQPIEVHITADTELAMSLNMGLYFAWLGFIAVWWDTMPAIELRRPLPIAEVGVSPAATATVTSSRISPTFLIRVRQLDFDADIAITKANVRLRSLIANGSLGPAHKSLQVAVDEISAFAYGDVAGRLQNTDLRLKSHRQAYEAGKEVADPVFLKLEVNTGEIELRLDVDHQTILRAHLADTLISLADDWSGFAADQVGGRALKLAFAVDAGRFDGVITLLAVPLLLRRVDAISGILDDQKLQASNDSPAFRARRASKTQTAGLGIAAAMMVSAKEHTKDFSPANFKIIQAVRFDLAGVDLGVYSQDVHESDFYRFKIGRIGADQVRDENEAKQPDRKVDLMVAYMTWETTDRGHAPKEKDTDLPVAQWIQRAASHDRREVASLPAMTLRMNSTELSHPPVLNYDFDLIWGETDGDIAFLPNFFEAFKRTIDSLIEELDKVKVEQLADSQRRAKLDGLSKASASETSPHKMVSKVQEDGDELALLVYNSRSTNPQHSLPRLKPLGEGTTDAARMLPMIKTGMAQIPVFSHRFMTLKLEDFMGFMLKLYEKQLDVKMDKIGDVDAVISQT